MKGKKVMRQDISRNELLRVGATLKIAKMAIKLCRNESINVIGKHGDIVTDICKADDLLRSVQVEMHHLIYCLMQTGYTEKDMPDWDSICIGECPDDQKQIVEDILKEIQDAYLK